MTMQSKLRIVCLSYLLVVFLAPNFWSQGQKKDITTAREEYWHRLEEILTTAKVPFDSNLMTPGNDWRNKIGPFIDQLPEDKKIVRESGPLKGVYFADTLYLPENVELSADTAIIVRHLVFAESGEGKIVTIKGPHKFYMFSMDTKVLDSTGEKIERPQIVINVSGTTGKNGFTGKPGTDGNNPE